MDKIDVKVFDGINNQEAGTHIDSKQCVIGENILINKPYGTLKPAKGFEKYNIIGMYNPIMAIFQLKKHRYGNTTGGSFSQTLFTLTGSRIIWGELQDDDYYYGYYENYTSAWSKYYTKSDGYGNLIYGGSFWNIELNGDNLFLCSYIFTHGYRILRFTVNSDNSLTLQNVYSNGSLSTSNCRCMYVDYNNDYAIFTGFNASTVYNSISNWSIGKLQLSTSTIIDAWGRPDLVGSGDIGAITQFKYNASTNKIYFADRTQNRIGETTLDATYTDFKTLGTSGNGNLQFNAPQGCYYDDSESLYYVCDTSNGRVIRTDIDGTYWQVVCANGTGFMKTGTPGYITKDPLTGLFLISDAGNDVIIKTDFNSIWSTYSVSSLNPWSLSFEPWLRYLCIGDSGTYNQWRFINIDSF